MAVALRDPVPCTHGKTAWHLFSAAEAFAPLLQESGHDGICLTHYSFDRAYHSALVRKLGQRHELLRQRNMARNESVLGVPKPLLDWAAETPCAMHDAQNGFKWALSPHAAGSPEVVQNLHIAIESLRNSALHLQWHLCPFLEEALAFDRTPYSRDQVYEFWTTLGVGADVVDELVDLSPWYTGGRLWVAGQCENDPQLLERVSRVFMYLLRLKRFTESRWCTAGPSCRALVACLSVGLDGLVAAVRKNPATSDYYIGGFARLTPKVRKYMALAAIVSYVPDGFLTELLEDDRVAKRLEVLEAVMVEELAWLEGLGGLTWQRLAHVVGPDSSAVEVRSESLLGGQVACSFITNRVLKVARGMPWFLVRGNVGEKMNDLASLSQPPADDVASKLYSLLRQGSAALSEG